MLMVESMQLMGAAAAPSPTMAGRASSLDFKSLEGWVDLRRPASHARINVLDLKDQIVKRVGHECANRYFSHFQSFISSRLSKQELDKLVVLTIGKENVTLHNQLIRAILSNAIHAETPPPPPLPSKCVPKLVKGARARTLNPNASDDVLPLVSPAVLSNGDSSFKGKHSLYDRDYKGNKFAPSHTGSLKEHLAPDLCRPIQYVEGGAVELDAESNSLLVPPPKRLRALHPTPTSNANPRETANLGIEGEETSLRTDNYARVSVCSGISGPTRRSPCLAFPVHLLMQEFAKEDYLEAAELPDAESMHNHMEQIATLEGLQGVSTDCPDLLNCALDRFLSRLVKACIDVVKCKLKPGQQKLGMKSPSQDKHVEDIVLAETHYGGGSGVWSAPGRESSMHGGEKNGPSIFLRDLKVAMDLNPQQLGENWPVQLEKIAFRLFDQEPSAS